MKRLLSCFLVLASLVVWAQAPNSIKYQTIVRADDGTAASFQAVDFKISILSGSATGTTVYSEEQFLSTNGNGLVSFNIGQGVVVNGSFDEIAWGSDSHFIKIEAKMNGSNNYNLMGIEEFTSVPYAFYAKNTANNSSAWQQNGDDIYYLNGNVGIKTDQPTEALTLGTDNRIQLSTVKNTLTYGAVMNFRWNAPDAKPGIHFQDADGNSKIALSAYDYFDYPSIQSRKFSIATSNLAGDLVERLNIPYGEDIVDISITNANLKLTDGNILQVGTEENDGLALYYGDVFIHGTKKMGIGDKDWETEGTYQNAQMEIYRSSTNVEFLIHDDAGTNQVGLHLRNGENDWKVIHDADFKINHEGSTFFKINTDGDVGIDVEEPIAKLDVNGNINVSSGFAYLVGGSGKAAFLPVTEMMVTGEMVGMNPNTGELRKFQDGDIFMGIVAEQAGFVENYEKGREKDSNFALIVSKGQIKANMSRLQLNGRLVATPDGQQIGVLLANGNVYLK